MNDEERVAVWASDDCVIVEIQKRFGSGVAESWASNPADPTRDRIRIYERPWPFPSVARRVDIARKQLEKRIAKRTALRERLQGQIT